MKELALFGGKSQRDEYLHYGRQWIFEEDTKAVNDVLVSPLITTGPKAAEFERDLCKLTGAKHAVVICNGTAALHASCAAIGLKEGDEVITTPITFAASANCVLYMGATPVFADINEQTWNIDPKKIEEKITSKTKAVIAVDYTGQAAQADEIKEICKKHGLYFIEDAAHAIGTKYKGKHIGCTADLTTFSFHPVKTITCGEGGAIVTDDDALYEKMVLFRSHGITRNAKYMKNGEIPYAGYNEQILLGYNYRMTDFQAALGISQLKKLEFFSRKRSEIVAKYNKAFADIPQITLQKTIADSDTTNHLYVIRLNLDMLKSDRNQIFKALIAENIGLQVHYVPVYYHEYYQKLGYKKGICPIAEKLYEEIMTLPLFPKMTDNDVEDVIQAIYKVIEYYKK